MDFMNLAYRARSRAVWADPIRAVRTLEGFAKTETDGGEDLVRAAGRVADSKLKAHLERHAQDELHHGDLAPGTSHLRTGLAEGQGLMRALRGRVSGLCQPTYVLDIPGGHGKVPVGPRYLSDDHSSVEDPWGVRHADLWTAQDPATS